MPINPSALSSPDPEEAPGGDAEVTRQDADQAAAEVQQRTEQEQPQRKRRTKAELIAAAVVPAPDALIEVKDAGTGAKVQRRWSEAPAGEASAVELVKAGQAEFVDKSLKYAVLKMEQEPVAASSAFAQPAQPSENPAEREVRYTVDGQALLKTGTTSGSDDNDMRYEIVTYSGDRGGSGTMNADEWELLSMSPPPRDGGTAPSNVPPDAELGDEVRVGAETMRVGHGGVLTMSPVAIDGEVVKPKRRWQRELGSGPNGPWQSTLLNANVPDGVPALINTSVFSDPQPVSRDNGHGEQASDVVEQAVHGGEPVVQSERLPRMQEDLGDGMIKISTGILEKIGMPQVEQFASASQLQVGPINISRLVFDDGRRTAVAFDDGRQGEVITAAVEGFELLDNTVEFIAARFRGQLQSFLQATGAIRQPVS